MTILGQTCIIIFCRIKYDNIRLYYHLKLRNMEVLLNVTFSGGIDSNTYETRLA